MKRTLSGLLIAVLTLTLVLCFGAALAETAPEVAAEAVEAVETVEALIEVQITPQRDKGFDRIAERIYQYEEVESCYLMSGGYDLTVIITGRTLREVALFVSQKLSTIEGVRSTATHFILKKYKQQNVIFAPKEEQKERLIFV